MYKLLLFFFICFCCCTHVCAQTGSADSIVVDGPVITSDSDNDNDTDYYKDISEDTALRFRPYMLNTDTLNDWKNKKEYAWCRDLDRMLKEKDNSNSRRSVYRDNSSSSFWGNIFASGFLTAVFWIIAGGLVLFIIYKLFLNKGLFGVSSAKKNAEESKEEDTGHDISGKNFEHLLNAAYAAGDYRLATRWLFLLTLQRLNDKEMIRFGTDKTNSAYVNELPPAKRNDFAALSLYYEYTWYGKAPLQKESFHMIRTKYNEFLNRI